VLKNAYKIFIGRPEGERPLGGPRHRWEDNIKIGGKALTGFIWLRIGIGGGLL
jgi:hypothetical protein